MFYSETVATKDLDIFVLPQETESGIVQIQYLARQSVMPCRLSNQEPMPPYHGHRLPVLIFCITPSIALKAMMHLSRQTSVL